LSASPLAWQAWALLSALFAALTAILAKLGVTGVDAGLAMVVRTAVILVAFSTVLVVSGRAEGLASIAGSGWLFLVLSGLATGASWLCYFRALQLGDAARVAPLDKLSVVLVAIFGVVLLGERLPLLAWAGVGLIATGALLVAIAE
jgi:transporter family protein